MLNYFLKKTISTNFKFQILLLSQGSREERRCNVPGKVIPIAALSQMPCRISLPYTICGIALSPTGGGEGGVGGEGENLMHILL